MDVPADISDVVQCAECEAEVTVFRFRDAGGWRCERCAPARRACRNKGCSYTDIAEKSYKHEQWFCQQRTMCRICHMTVRRGTLSAHYDSVHQDITYRAGSTWRATPTAWRDCFLSSVAGTAVCRYKLTHTQFVLWVHTPVPSERLREFRCVVTLTNPTTGHTRTCTPDVEYSETWDWSWSIEVNELNFQSGTTKFDVSLDIIQSEP